MIFLQYAEEVRREGLRDAFGGRRGRQQSVRYHQRAPPSLPGAARGVLIHRKLAYERTHEQESKAQHLQLSVLKR